MLFEEYKILFSPNSIGRYDIAPIFTNIDVFEHEALGFIIGSSISIRLHKGLVLIRKAGKIPLSNDTIIKRQIIDYSGNSKTLELNKNLIRPNDCILLVDDWVETGTQIKATISMIEELGAKIIGVSCIGADKNEDTQVLFEQYNLHSIGVNV
jgi:adenine phosphoribosyltransferase